MKPRALLWLCVALVAALALWKRPWRRIQTPLATGNDIAVDYLE